MATQPNTPKMLTVAELVARIRVEEGVAVSHSAVFRWIANGTRGHHLKAKFVGGMRYIAWEDYVAFAAAINAGGHPTQPTLPTLSTLLPHPAFRPDTLEDALQPTLGDVTRGAGDIRM